MHPLISGNPVSPHVRALVFTLTEKQVSFTLDPSDARVPTVQHGSDRIQGAEPCLRFLESAFPAVSLVPSDAGARARMDRALEVYYEEATVTLGWRVAAPWVHAIATSTPVAKMAAAHVSEARRTVGTLEAFLSADPYFAGDRLSLADVAISSLFEHLSTFDDYQRLVPLGSSLREWFSRVSARAAFESTRQRGGAIPGLVLAA